MLRLILAVALFVPALAWAQQPQSTNSQAEIAAFLARNLSTMAGENDALHAQVADLQKQLAEMKAKETPK